MAGPAETQPEPAQAGLVRASRVPRRAYAVAAAIAVLVAGIRLWWQAPPKLPPRISM